jgi:hypothetical protein
MGQRPGVAGHIAGLKEMTDVVAIPPTKRSTAAATPVASEVSPSELEAFRDAGWEFVPATADESIGARRVYRGNDGRLVIDGGQVSVRFAPDTTDRVVEQILSTHGLTIGRKHGFGPKLFDVTKSDDRESPINAVDVAKELAGHPEVEYAEPVLIETIPGRGHR